MAPSGVSDCPGGEAEPISTSQALAALQENGFSTEEDPESCAGAADIVMVLGNTDASDEEGHVICSVRRRPIYGDGFSHLSKSARMTAKMVQDNVECSLYARVDAAAETAQLRSALRDMESNKNQR